MFQMVVAVCINFRSSTKKGLDKSSPKGQLKYARALNLPLKFTYFRERRWQKWLNLRLYGILPSTSDSLKM
ncbi:MAG: hypothetical protein IKF09_02920, partial [Clostridiales bacterium]|nr:hypothetical protein [Clostridiales bacterium]